jgi:LacI family transcriptional regulator
MDRGAKVVTLQDVADLIGVHKSTVHRALRGDPRVESGTATRIQAAAAKLGYDPEANQAARRLSQRRFGNFESPHMVALFFPVLFSRSAYFLRQFHGFMEVMSDSGFDVLTRIVGNHEWQQFPSAVARGDVDAVVSLAHESQLMELRAQLLALPGSVQRPFITLINPLPGAWSVTADFRQGGRLAAAHLLDLGHQRILTIDGLSNQHRERLVGIRDELQARGLDPAKHLVAIKPDETISPWHAQVADSLDRGLAKAPGVTAIIAPNDQVAALLFTLLAKRGRPVPERMSLIGCDDTDPLLGPGHQNILTSVALPLEDIGRATARMAMALGSKPRSEVLPVNLQVRGTTQRVGSGRT